MRERDAQKSRESILAAAEAEFAEKGFYGARVDEIAARAAINKRMLYAYFGDKEALYKEVLFRVYRRMETVEQRLVEARLVGKELIRAIIGAYFSFLHENPSVVHILMWENLNKGRYLQEMEQSRIERRTFAYFKEELERGKAEGIFRPEVDSTQTVLSLITVSFANFSNQFTLSRLFGIDLAAKEQIELRRAHTEQLVLTYLCKEE